jgi:hypothetical protein
MDEENTQEFRDNIKSQLAELQKHFPSGGIGEHFDNKLAPASHAQKVFLKELGMESINVNLTIGQASNLISCNLLAQEERYEDLREKLKPFENPNSPLKYHINFILLEHRIESSLEEWYQYHYSPKLNKCNEDSPASSLKIIDGQFWQVIIKGKSEVDAFNLIYKEIKNAPLYKKKLFKSFISIEGEVSIIFKEITKSKRFYSRWYVDCFIKDVIEKNIQECPSPQKLAHLIAKNRKIKI